jgi:hypothetical protein
VCRVRVRSSRKLPSVFPECIRIGKDGVDVVPQFGIEGHGEPDGQGILLFLCKAAVHGKLHVVYLQGKRGAAGLDNRRIGKSTGNSNDKDNGEIKGGVYKREQIASELGRSIISLQTSRSTIRFHVPGRGVENRVKAR